MTAFSQYFTRTIAPGANAIISATGTVFKCKKCSVAAPYVTVGFNAGDANPISAGDTFDLSKVNASFTEVIITNNHPTLAATVSFTVGNIVVTFNPPDTQLASTYAKGNLGLTANGNYVSDSGVSQAITFSSGKIVVPNTGFLTIYGTDKGHQRKLIVINVTSSDSVNVCDANGCFLFNAYSGNNPIVAIETDATIKLQLGSGSTPLVNIAEFYFAAA